MLQPSSTFHTDSQQDSRAPFGRREVNPSEEQTPGVPVLGKTLLFRGELTAEEDVILQGRVEGSIRHARNLTIGTDGSVLGDIYASHLTVEGLVEGDLHCTEGVVVRATAQVRGNIYAPRVGIMEGATFNGRIEMDGAAAARSNEGRQPTRQPAAPQRTPSPQASAPTRATAAVAPAASSPSTSGASAPLASSEVDQMLNAQRQNKK